VGDLHVRCAVEGAAPELIRIAGIVDGARDQIPPGARPDEEDALGAKVADATQAISDGDRSLLDAGPPTEVTVDGVRKPATLRAQYLNLMLDDLTTAIFECDPPVCTAEGASGRRYRLVFGDEDPWGFGLVELEINR
jgi:hypothetical protein